MSDTPRVDKVLHQFIAKLDAADSDREIYEAMRVSLKEVIHEGKALERELAATQASFEAMRQQRNESQMALGEAMQFMSYDESEVSKEAWQRWTKARDAR